MTDAIEAAFTRCVQQIEHKLAIEERRGGRRLVVTNIRRDRVGNELRVSIRCGIHGCFSASTLIESPGCEEKSAYG